MGDAAIAAAVASRHALTLVALDGLRLMRGDSALAFNLTGPAQAFTRVAAHTLADPPEAGLCPRCFDGSVTLAISRVATKAYRHLLGPDFHRPR